jgi:hypothetical protein
MHSVYDGYNMGSSGATHTHAAGVLEQARVKAAAGDHWSAAFDLLDVIDWVADHGGSSQLRTQYLQLAEVLAPHGYQQVLLEGAATWPPLT